MWFKKKAYINGYNSNKAVDGTDWRTTTERTEQNWPVSLSLPSAADAGNYFYLPALGAYGSGALNYIGSDGVYWSSSASPWRSGSVYILDFYSDGVDVGLSKRENGHRVGGFE